MAQSKMLLPLPRPSSSPLHPMQSGGPACFFGRRVLWVRVLGCRVRVYRKQKKVEILDLVADCMAFGQIVTLLLRSR